ncbi:MAG TPA: transcriptional regulator [Cyanothece sp. UBA12306]|nr:transcriptional regulator [Cyanothece sp. UBA12306]
MNNVKTIASQNYDDFIIEKLQNSQHAAGFLEAILEEENPEPQLLKNALLKVIKAYQNQHDLSNVPEKFSSQFNKLLNQDGGEEIYEFVNFLDQLGLKIKIEVK